MMRFCWWNYFGLFLIFSKLNLIDFSFYWFADSLRQKYWNETTSNCKDKEIKHQIKSNPFKRSQYQWTYSVNYHSTNTRYSISHCQNSWWKQLVWINNCNYNLNRNCKSKNKNHSKLNYRFETKITSFRFFYQSYYQRWYSETQIFYLWNLPNKMNNFFLYD